MDPAVPTYVDAIPETHRPLFERLQTLILDLYPDTDASTSGCGRTTSRSTRSTRTRSSSAIRPSSPAGVASTSRSPTRYPKPTSATSFSKRSPGPDRPG